MFSKTQLVGALAGFAFLAGCGGGGKTTAGVPAVVAPSSSPGTTQQLTSGTRISFTINRGKSSHAHYTHASAAHRKSRAASAKRSPKYFSDVLQGLQVTISAPGATTQTKYYDVSDPEYAGGANFPCAEDANNNDIYTCVLTLPIVGSSESISALEVDQLPTNENTTTLQGTAFPVNSNILAVGNATATTTPGTITDVSISMNPVVGKFLDCCDYVAGSTAPSNSIGYDESVSPYRVVMTASVAQQALIQTVGAYDIDSSCIYPPRFPSPTDPDPNPTPQGQPFVDVNGSPLPVTATSSSTHLALLAVPLTYNEPTTPPASAPFAQTASFSGSQFTDDCFFLGLNYDGTNVATNLVNGPTSATITFNDNQTAVPAPFTGPSTGGAAATTYAATYVYPVTFIDVYPHAVNYYGSAIPFTGFDIGAAAEGMQIDPTSTCVSDNGGTGDFTFTPLAYNAATGTQQFNVSVGSNQTGASCTFDLIDAETGVQTQSAQITYSVP